MIKIDQNYTDYRDDTDPKYPGGKAINATAAESTDGTPLLADWMNDINGAFQAIFIEAFGDINKVSGKPDNAEESDVLKAIKKLLPKLASQGDYSGKNSAQGIGLVKTANKAPNTKEMQLNEPWAASPNWVYNLLTGGAQDDVNNAVTEVLKKRVDGCNADTVDGYHAGNGTGMLVPVTAFEAGGENGYIKFGNGLLLQWGAVKGVYLFNNPWTSFFFPLSFQSTDYAIVCVAELLSGLEVGACSIVKKRTSGAGVRIWNDNNYREDGELNYIAVGL